ncbi:MAG: DNA recombination protein RmuC, partial [Thermoanaerobaculia bacterium]
LRAAERSSAERDLARNERETIKGEMTELQRRIEAAQQARAVAETQVVEAEKAVLAHQSFVEASKKQLEDRFAALANATLKSVGDQLLQLGKTQFDGSKGEIVQSLETKRAEIETLLTPLREMVESYRGELVKSEQVRNEVYGGLQEQIRSLLIAQEGAQREAARLATAFQSPTVRGSWGEVTLRRCVEMAGLSEYCDFFTQETFSSEEGRRLRPDLIVRLPNNRVIAVDSKAPTGDYAAASEAADDEQRRILLTAHSKNLKRHIEALSRKEYQAAVGEGLDFTVMFLPGEHLLSAALVTDPELFEFAVQRKVYVASPTVLLPLLRAVQAGWKAEKTEENAKRMHDAAVELFQRFVVVMEHLAGVGDQLRKTVESYNRVIRSIDSRLWPKGQELQQMAGSGKDLGELRQVDTLPAESTKLRLAIQAPDDEPMLVP